MFCFVLVALACWQQNICTRQLSFKNLNDLLGVTQFCSSSSDLESRIQSSTMETTFKVPVQVQREIKIECLEKIEDLKSKCRQQGLEFSYDVNPCLEMMVAEELYADSSSPYESDSSSQSSTNEKMVNKPVQFGKEFRIECLEMFEDLKSKSQRQGLDVSYDLLPGCSGMNVKESSYADRNNPYESDSSDHSSTNEKMINESEQIETEITTDCTEIFEIWESKDRVQEESDSANEVKPAVSRKRGQQLICNFWIGKAYEVDMIFADKLFQDERHYFIKWKDYTTDHNTWEPECHLKGCPETIEYYHAMRNPDVKLNRNLLQYFVKDLTTRKPYDFLTLTKVCALGYGCSEAYVTSLQLTLSQMKSKIRDLLNLSHSRINKLSKKLVHVMKFGESRKRVLINLKEWEYEINTKNEGAYIKVENNVDLETAPAGFEFVHDYINTTIIMPEEPVAFCHCQDCYSNKTACCPHDSEGYFAYSRHQRLLLKPGYPIYECNKRCKCSIDCANRVVQHGQKVRVCIFRTSNKCGWGLKTLDTIEKGQFVLEYLGEIITSEAAESRGRIYDYIGRSYLFDLDYGEDFCCYTVDAGHVGNAAHFINHSCEPNLHVFAVWINQPNPNLPRLAFFAKRKIRRGEELTFDYKMVQKDRFGPQNPMPEHERILCRCNSKNCRKYLF